ncbi:PPR domain-containing protein/PPR_2 domain-containing protein/PPR_3 domain-containing protein [Cephalotus follicularis]|uniref:PPR domain-containing protein/PPR_2 domain-containing protein/PPR_3 domain-containing protein n=1 Tax=Cephalotus follicularis TaxID=3775 RepID=A0A1Q3BJU1_CEPFO|nr:PPR domain-containing protein/PPR_2 domain-containing protein/PPR_3 domain-containing protein [Cephalotus follicularis]
MFSPLKYLTVGSRLQHILHTSVLTKTFKSSTHQSLHLLLDKCFSMTQLYQIHAQIILHGLPNQNLTLGKLIFFCAITSTGDLKYAQLVFDKIPEPNKFMFNSLIRGYSNTDDPTKAILLYRDMIGSGLSPNEFTLPFVLKACASRSAYWEAVLVHCQAIKSGTGSQVCVQNALINVYVVCGLISFAQQVFDDISERTLVSWNSMIAGYSKMGFCKKAFLLFMEIKKLGVEPDKYTLVSLLSVCSQTYDIDLGRYVHLCMEVTGINIDLVFRNALLDMYAKCGHLQSARTVFDRMPDKNVVSWTSLLGAYSKCGLFESARDIFNQIPVKNVISWNCMISCYVQENRCRQALDLFHEMCNSGVAPDESTLVCVLSACSQIGDFVMGQKIHNDMSKHNVTPSVTLWNSLVNMYAKCGALGTAMDIFNEMPEKNLVSWNVIIGALALHGSGLEAINVFEEMQVGGIWPNEITFTGLLSACNHNGLIEMGRLYFDRMKYVYGIPPDIEHYACMVDLLGRGGHFREAVRLIGGMPMKPDVMVWGALLGACRTHGNVDIGKQIMKQVLELEPYSAGLYVLLSNLFGEAKKWEDAKNIRKLMNDSKIIKSRALSFIEIEGRVYEFMVDDQKLDISTSMYSIFDQLTNHLKSTGYSYKSLNAILDV